MAQLASVPLKVHLTSVAMVSIMCTVYCWTEHTKQIKSRDLGAIADLSEPPECVCVISSANSVLP